MRGCWCVLVRGGGVGMGMGGGWYVFFFCFSSFLFCFVVVVVGGVVVGLRLGPFFYFLTINQSFFFLGGLKWFKFSKLSNPRNNLSTADLLESFSAPRRRIPSTARWRTWSVCSRRSVLRWRRGPISPSEFFWEPLTLTLYLTLPYPYLCRFLSLSCHVIVMQTGWMDGWGRIVVI